MNSFLCLGFFISALVALDYVDPVSLLFPSSSSGNPSVLVRLIHDGQLKLDKVEDHSQEELKAILDACGVTISPDATKVCVCVYVCVYVCNACDFMPVRFLFCC